METRGRPQWRIARAAADARPGMIENKPAAVPPPFVWDLGKKVKRRRAAVPLAVAAIDPRGHAADQAALSGAAPAMPRHPRYSTLPHTEMLWPLIIAPSSEHRNAT